MRIGGKLLPEEVREVRRLVRSRWYWPKILVSNLSGLLVALAVFWLMVQFALERNWKSSALCLLTMVIVGVYAYVATVRSDKQAMDRFHKGLPDWLDIDTQGIHLSFDDGRTSFFPRTTVTKAICGECVLLLRVGPDDGFFCTRQWS